MAWCLTVRILEAGFRSKTWKTTYCEFACRCVRRPVSGIEKSRVYTNSTVRYYQYASKSITSFSPLGDGKRRHYLSTTLMLAPTAMRLLQRLCTEKRRLFRRQLYCMVHAILDLVHVTVADTTAQPCEMGRGQLASLRGCARPMRVHVTVREHTSPSSSWKTYMLVDSIPRFKIQDHAELKRDWHAPPMVTSYPSVKRSCIVRQARPISCLLIHLPLGPYA
jgi:hypothetical protein